MLRRMSSDSSQRVTHRRRTRNQSTGNMLIRRSDVITHVNEKFILGDRKELVSFVTIAAFACWLQRLMCLDESIRM